MEVNFSRDSGKIVVVVTMKVRDHGFYLRSFDSYSEFRNALVPTLLAFEQEVLRRGMPYIPHNAEEAERLNCLTTD